MSSESIAAEPGMTYSRWLDLLRRSQSTTPFLSCDPTKPLLDRDMFSVIWGPSIAAISVGKCRTELSRLVPLCKLTLYCYNSSHQTDFGGKASALGNSYIPRACSVAVLCSGFRVNTCLLRGFWYERLGCRKSHLNCASFGPLV
jgi:hypothetical protein